jgi:polysaccharide biosynthesis/export protein
LNYGFFQTIDGEPESDWATGRVRTPKQENLYSVTKRFIIFMAIVVAWHGGPVCAADTNNPVAKETATTMDSLDDRRKLGPGDSVTYRVIEDQDEPRSLTVTDSGDLEVPYYGLVRASGKTSRQLAGDVKTLLERQLYHQATVIIAVEVVNKTRVVGKVYVTGQVRNSGGYEIPAGENLTVTRAILIAGGFSDFSDKKNVRLVRKTADGKKTFVINVQSIWEKGDLEKDQVVQPDDLIVVPARLVNY